MRQQQVQKPIHLNDNHVAQNILLENRSLTAAATSASALDPVIATNFYENVSGNKVTGNTDESSSSSRAKSNSGSSDYVTYHLNRPKRNSKNGNGKFKRELFANSSAHDLVDTCAILQTNSHSSSSPNLYNTPLGKMSLSAIVDNSGSGTNSLKQQRNNHMNTNVDSVKIDTEKHRKRISSDMGNSAQKGSLNLVMDDDEFQRSIFSPITTKLQGPTFTESTPINQSTRSFISNTSTPLEKSSQHSYSGDFSFASQDSSKWSHDRSQRSRNSPLCLGDFISGPMKTKRKSGQKSNVEEKPKKRVVPTTITKTVHSEFTSISFKSDTLFQPEEEMIQPSNDRLLLQTQKDTIKEDFWEQEEPRQNLHSALRDKFNSSPVKLIEVNLEAVTARKILDRLSSIYSLLIDLNLTLNVLAELAFLINLVNTQLDPNIDHDTQDLNHVLKNINNCIYFALETLSKQKHLLFQLDATTIKVLINNDRLSTHKPELIKELTEVQQQKWVLEQERLGQEGNFMVNGSRGLTHVFYQQENDTLEYFPTARESAAFRKQRDVFYQILR